MAFFLYFFRPFNLNSYQGDLLVLCGLFGLATIVGGQVYYAVLTYGLKIRKDNMQWTFAKWLICSIGMLVIIASCNLAVLWYVYDGNSAVLSLSTFGKMFLHTIAIGIFPITLSGVILFYRYQKYFEKQAGDIFVNRKHPTTPEETIYLPSQYSESFSCEVNDLYSLEARDNYVSITWIQNGALQSRMIRNSLSAIEQELPPTTFFRCHRSFIVNLDKVTEVSGNAQGLILSLHSDVRVPVSRTYIQPLKNRLAD